MTSLMTAQNRDVAMLKWQHRLLCPHGSHPFNSRSNQTTQGALRCWSFVVQHGSLSSLDEHRAGAVSRPCQQGASCQGVARLPEAPTRRQGPTGAAMMTSRSAGPCGVARVSRQPERPRSPESFGAQMPCIIRQHMAGVGGRCEPVGEALIGRAEGILSLGL